MRPEKKLKIAVLKLHSEGKSIEEIARFTGLKKQENVIEEIIAENLGLQENIEKLDNLIGLDNLKIVNVSTKNSKWVIESTPPAPAPEPEEKEENIIETVLKEQFSSPPPEPEPDINIINLIINAPKNIEDDYKHYYYNQYSELNCKPYNEYSAVFDYFLKSRNIFWQNLTCYDIHTLIRLYNDILYLI
jgi:hypothetical protein